MKRLLSLMLVFSMLIVSVPVFADGGQQVEPIIEITDNEHDGDNFKLGLQWVISDVKKGDYFNITFPLPINIDDNDVIEVVSNGNTHTIIFKDDFKTAYGNIGGSRQVKSEELSPITINGEAVPVDHDTPQGGTTTNPEVADRDRIYKHGFIQEDNTIHWEVTIGGDGKGVTAGTKVTDEIGKGHKLIKDSLKFEVIDEFGNYNEQLAEMVIRDKKTSSNEIEFTIDGISPGEVLIFSYTTQITNSEQGKFENALIVENEKKVSQSVTTDSWGDAGGEKPTTPEEPEELPQVGEFFARPEYIIAVILLIVARFMKKKEK